MTDRIKAWSYSRLGVFESCKQRAKLAYIDRIPEPDRGPPPRGLKEWPNDRGTRIHDHAEKYIMGEAEFIPEMENFRAEFVKARELYDQGKCIMEHMWCFDDTWNIVSKDDFANIWCRIIIDLCVFLDDETVVVVDYKTGKRYGNEVKHAQQCQLYMLAVFLRYPKVQKVTTELWYLDLDEKAEMDFTRKQGMHFLKGFNQRGLDITNCTDFPANPNAFTCKWCPYGPKNSGHCEVGVQCD